MAWLIFWETTYRCNLNCRYCLAGKDIQDEDPERAVCEIIRRRPKRLIVTGGEPTLVRGLSGYLKRIKEEGGNPGIAMLSNLVNPPELYEPVLPYLEVLHCSVDALGEVNKLQRGVSGDLLIDHLRGVMELRARLPEDRRPEVVVAPVVTRESYRHITSLVESIHEIGSHIFICFGAMEPHGHPDSVTCDMDTAMEFKAIVARLRDRGFNVHLFGVLRQPPYSDEPHPEFYELDEKGVAVRVRCYRQFFRGMVRPSGRFETCKSGHYVRYYTHSIREAWRSGKPGEAIRKMAEMADHLVLRKTHACCPAPCACDEFMEYFFYVRGAEDIPPEFLKTFGGRFEPWEIERDERFIRKRLRGTFPAEAIRALKKK